MRHDERRPRGTGSIAAGSGARRTSPELKGETGRKQLKTGENNDEHQAHWAHIDRTGVGDTRDLTVWRARSRRKFILDM